MSDAPPIGFVRREGSGKVFCRTCGSGGYEGGSWMDTCRFGHAPCPRCGVITTMLPNGKARTHGTCPKPAASGAAPPGAVPYEEKP